jgi:hypothetical protein
MSGRQQRVMVQPIVSSSVLFIAALILISSLQNVIFKNLQQVCRELHHLALICPDF